MNRIPQPSGLPAQLRPLFWDYDWRRLSWKEDRELIIGRVLAEGDWQAMKWLRARIGDAALRDWFESHRGRGLSPERLRFWELILGLPHRTVNAWLAQKGRRIWDQRTHRRSSTRKS